MKIKLTILLALFFGALYAQSTIHASGVQDKIVPEGVEWLLHIDADLLRQTQSGSTLIREFQALKVLDDNPEVPIDPILIVNGLRGITAFGSLPDFETGEAPADAVVVIEGTPDLMQVFQGMVAGMQLEKPEMLVSVQSGEQTILMLNGQDFAGTFLDESRIVLGKSLGSLDTFLSTYSGHLPHLSLAGRFPTFRMGAESGFFLGAVVEGINGFKNLPAQARILQLTQAVSLQLGEVDENLRLMTALKTDSPQTAQQVMQVLQGIIALMNMTQTGQPDYAALVQSARVSLSDNTVSLGLSYPVARAETWIEELALMAKASLEAKKEAVEVDSSVDEASAESDAEESAATPAE